MKIEEHARMGGAPARGRTSVRAQAAGEWLARLDTAAADWESQLATLPSTVAEALVHGDSLTLQELLDPVRDELARLFETRGHARELRAYLLAMLATIRAGLEWIPEAQTGAIAAEGHAREMLDALAERIPLSSQQLRERLKTNPSQISRVGRQLLASGLVVQRRAGRTATWEITPRGLQAVEDKQPSRRRANSS